MLIKKDSVKNDVKTAKSTKSPTDQPLAKTPTQQPAKITPNPTAYTSLRPTSTQKKNQITRLTVKCDVGFQNQVTIRGNGANLNWTAGTPLKNIKADEWLWETHDSFQDCQFKVLINDQQYEQGENHTLRCGTSTQLHPHF